MDTLAESSSDDDDRSDSGDSQEPYDDDDRSDSGDSQEPYDVDVRARIADFEQLTLANEPPRSASQGEAQGETQSQEEEPPKECSVSCCKFNKTNRIPIFCPNPDCNSAICKECFLEWFSKPCNEFICPFCNREVTIISFLERNHQLPKNFIHKLLKNLSDGAFLREQIRYQENLHQFEIKKEIEDLKAQSKALVQRYKEQSRDFNIYEHHTMLRDLTRAAKDVHACPIPECTGACFNGKCQKCNILVCMNCMCQKTGKKDLKHGKKGKCSILEGCGDEPKRVNPKVAELLHEIHETEQKIAKYDAITYEYHKNQAELDEQIRRVNGGEGSSTKKKYGPRCPNPECNGYVEIQNWKCSSCEVRVCAQCHVVREENHNCNPDTVATIELMKKDTKSCPTCSTPIHKISGCSQMYCTHCEALWDWNTEKVLDKKQTFIHNPHLLRVRAERREQGLVEQQMPEDIHCRDPVNERQMRNRFEESSANTPKDTVFEYLAMPDYVINDTRFMMRNIEIYQTEQTAKRNKLMFLYFKNNLSEETWKKELKSILKLEERNKELIPVFENHIECFHILAWRYILGELTTPEYLKHYQALQNLATQRFSVINHIFGLKVPKFSTWGNFT